MTIEEAEQSATESFLERWTRLDVALECARATKALREAVHALQVINSIGGPAGEMAGVAILRVRDELMAGFDCADEVA